MKTLVIYDSAYGNTEKIAKAIGGAMSGDVQVLHVNQFSPDSLGKVDFLFVGSPTQAGRATKPVQELLDKIPAPALKGMRVATFDTRISAKWVGIFGYAAGRIAQNLKANGATLVAPPEPFFVNGKEGPLKEGELERAADWAKKTAGMATAPAR